jgi:hypothetical protein
VKPWVELVQTGTFSDDTLALLPLSYQTTDAWLALVEASAAKFGTTWLHAVHLAINYAERGEVERPLSLLKQSTALNDNPLAWRCIAVLQQSAELAWPFFQRAMLSLATGPFAQDPAAARLGRNLATEVSFFLQQAEWWEELESFLLTPLAQANTDLDAVITAQVKVLEWRGGQENLSQARGLLGKHCFPTYASARDDLMGTTHVPYFYCPIHT